MAAKMVGEYLWLARRLLGLGDRRAVDAQEFAPDSWAEQPVPVWRPGLHFAAALVTDFAAAYEFHWLRSVTDGRRRRLAVAPFATPSGVIDLPAFSAAAAADLVATATHLQNLRQRRCGLRALAELYAAGPTAATALPKSLAARLEMSSTELLALGVQPWTGQLIHLRTLEAPPPWQTSLTGFPAATLEAILCACAGVGTQPGGMLLPAADEERVRAWLTAVAQFGVAAGRHPAPGVPPADVAVAALVWHGTAACRSDDGDNGAEAAAAVVGRCLDNVWRGDGAMWRPAAWGDPVPRLAAALAGALPACRPVAWEVSDDYPPPPGHAAYPDDMPPAARRRHYHHAVADLAGVLADALEDAGCADALWLATLRAARWPCAACGGDGVSGDPAVASLTGGHDCHPCAGTGLGLLPTRGWWAADLACGVRRRYDL